MTISGRQIDEGTYPLIPGALISYRSGSELYSVVVSDGVDAVFSFPRARYYYLENNIIHEQHSCVLSIPPKYQFLTTQFSDGEYTLRFCDSEGTLLTVDDVAAINHDQQGSINALDVLKHAQIPTVSDRNVLLRNGGPLVQGVEHIISETNLQKVMQAATEGQPIFVLGSLKSSAEYEPVVGVFPFSSEGLPEKRDFADSIGMLNNESTAIGLNHDSGVATLWYFSTTLREPAHQRVKFTSYPEETANAAKSALDEHHIYLVVEDGDFYLSEAVEGSITDNPEQARSILGRAHLIAEGGALDHLPGKYSFRITVDDSSTRIGNASYKGADVLSDVAVLVGEDAIPIRAPNGGSLLIRNFLLEHSKMGNDGPVIAFQKNLSNHALAALIGNHFVLQVLAPDGQAPSYISAAGKPIMPGISPVTALLSRTTRSISHADHDEGTSSQVVTEAAVQSAQQPSASTAALVVDGVKPAMLANEDNPLAHPVVAAEVKDPVDNNKPVSLDGEASDDAGMAAEKEPVDGVKPAMPDSGADLSTDPMGLHIDDMLLEDARSALALRPTAIDIAIPNAVKAGVIVPGRPIYDVETGTRVHPAVFLSNSEEEYEFPLYSYDFRQDARIVAYDIYGGKVELSPEYHFLKVVREKSGSDGVLYKLAFCDNNGSAVDPRAITLYSQDKSKIGAYNKVVPPQQAIPSSISDVQLVANGLIETSLKDLYKAQGSGPAITLHPSPTDGAAIAVISASKAPNRGEILGKLNENVVYFDVNASPIHYTHYFHYGNVLRSIPLPEVDSLVSVLREESEQILLGLTRQGFVYYRRDSAPQEDEAIFVKSEHDLRAFIRNAEMMLNGEAEQLEGNFVLRFALDGQKVCDKRASLGCTFGVSAILGDTLHKLSLSDGDIVLSGNALELVYLPNDGVPELLCSESVLGKRAVTRVMDALPLVHHQKIDGRSAGTLVSLHDEILVKDNSLPSQPLLQRVAADAMDEEDIIDYAEGGVELLVSPGEETSPPANTPPVPDNNTQKPHGVAVAEGGNTAAPEAYINRGHDATVTLPLILGPEVSFNPKSRVTRYQIQLKVHDEADSENPALPLSKYSFKEGKVVCESAGEYSYTFSLIPDHQFLEVVQGSEGKYHAVFCDSRGRMLTKQNFVSADGISYADDMFAQSSRVSRGYEDFLRDGNALKVERMLAAGEGFKVIDLESVYDARKPGPHFRLAKDPGSGQVAVVECDSIYPGDDNYALLNPEYAFFEHDSVAGECTLFLSNAAGLVQAGGGFPAVDLGTTFAFPLAVGAHKATMAQSRIAVLEEHPIYGVVRSSGAYFTSSLEKGFPLFEDEEHAQRFLQCVSDGGNKDPTANYAVKIVATNKHAAQLQGIGVKVGREVFPVPIKMKNSAGNTVTSGLAEISPLTVERLVNDDAGGFSNSWDLSGLHHKVLSEFLSRKAIFELHVDRQDASVREVVLRLPGEAQEVTSGRAILSSVLTGNEDSIVGRSAGEFLQKVRKARHVDDVDEPVTYANALPATHTPPEQPAPEGDEGATRTISQQITMPATPPPVPSEAVMYSEVVFPLHINPKNGEDLVLEAIIHNKGKLLSVPKAAYFFSEDGQLLAQAHEFPTMESPQLDEYAKVIKQPNGRYALQICGEDGETTPTITHQDMKELYVEPDIFMEDWSLHDMYEGTKGAPAFLLEKGEESIGGRTRVDLLPAPKNYLSSKYEENSYVAHLSTGQMVFSLDDKSVDKSAVTLEYKSALTDKQRQEVNVVWEYDEDATNPKHSDALRVASNKQPLYLVISGGNIAWTLDKNEDDLTFFQDSLMLSWARDTLAPLSDEGLEQRYTLMLTLGESRGSQQVIVARALLEDGTPGEILPQPSGRELYFDRTAYDVNARYPQEGYVSVEHDVISAWQNTMLAAVVPLVFSLVGRTGKKFGAKTVWYIARGHDMYEIGDVSVGVYQADDQGGDSTPVIIQQLQEYLVEPILPLVPEYGSSLKEDAGREGSDDFHETQKEPVPEERKPGVGVPSEDSEEEDSEEEDSEEEDTEEEDTEEEDTEEEDTEEEDTGDDSEEEEDAEEKDPNDDSDKTLGEPVPAENEREIAIPQNLRDVDYGQDFDVQRWSDSVQNIVSITEHDSPMYPGCYQPWVNAEHSDMLHFHENVNAKYRSQEYTYGQAMELYYSVTTEPCRYPSHSIFPIINGLVYPDGQVTVGQHPLGSLESFNEMFSLA
ncbi:MAG: hypothetical protein ACTJLK_01835 [Anaplasma sp.]